MRFPKKIYRNPTFILFLILGIVGICWYIFTGKGHNFSKNITTNSSIIQNTTANVGEYINNKYKFKFSYPKRYELTETNVDYADDIWEPIQITLTDTEEEYPGILFEILKVKFEDGAKPNLELTLILEAEQVKIGDTLHHWTKGKLQPIGKKLADISTGGRYGAFYSYNEPDSDLYNNRTTYSADWLRDEKIYRFRTFNLENKIEFKNDFFQIIDSFDFLN